MTEQLALRKVTKMQYKLAPTACALLFYFISRRNKVLVSLVLLWSQNYNICFPSLGKKKKEKSRSLAVRPGQTWQKAQKT